jgi:hypothetical protein
MIIIPFFPNTKETLTWDDILKPKSWSICTSQWNPVSVFSHSLKGLQGQGSNTKY